VHKPKPLRANLSKELRELITHMHQAKETSQRPSHFRPKLNSEGADRPALKFQGAYETPGGPARGAIFQRSTELSTERPKGQLPFATFDPAPFAVFGGVSSWTWTAALPNARDRSLSPLTSSLKATCVSSRP
jgi:hypothetical protein